MASSRRAFLKTGAAAGTILSATGMRTTAARAADSPVRHRELGKTGWKVSEVGFGAMNMRDAELVQAAIDSGINYIDTAHGYMNGENEEVVGKVMLTARDKVFLTTKLSTRGGPDQLADMMETSLRRLKTDHVDLVLMHGARSRDQVLGDEYRDAFASLKDKGYTRFVGVSTHSNITEVVDAVRESDFWDAVLAGYNYNSPPELTEAIVKARKAGIATIAMKTQLKGSGKSGGPTTPNQEALKWVLSNPQIDTTVPGMTTFEQLAEDVAVMGMELTYHDTRALRRFSDASKDGYCCGVSGCTGCKDKCPKGVAVNEINRCLGYAHGYGDLALARENYRELPVSSTLAACSDCDECEVACINGLDLTAQIHRARELFC